MNLKATLLLFFAALCTGHPVAGAEPSPDYPHLIQTYRGTQIPAFFPGNIGSGWFGEKPAKVQNPYLQDELPIDGYVLKLESNEYAVHAWEERAGKNGTFWQLARIVLNNMPEMGAVLDMRITDDLMRQVKTKDASRMVVEGFTSATRDLPVPLVTFEGSVGQQELALRDLLREAVPGVLIGRYDAPALTRAEMSGWDFLCARPEAAPPALQGQAAVSYFRSIAPGRPVLLIVKTPDFYQQLMWTATGSAGFYHDPPLGEKETPAWQHLRALVQFKRRVKPGATVLLPEMQGGNVLGAFGVRGETYNCFLAAGESQLSIPYDPERPSIVQLWYLPAMDQQIAEPRTMGHRDGQYRVGTPSKEPWIFTQIHLPAEKDTDTSTPRVEIDPDFDLLDDTQLTATLSSS